MHQLTDNIYSGPVIESNKIVPLDETGSVRAHVEVAFKTDNNDLIWIGWLFDCENQVRGLSVLHPKREGFVRAGL